MNNFDLNKLLEQLAYNSKEPLLFNSGFFLFFMLVFLFFYQFLYKKKLLRVTYFTLFSLYFFYKACGFYFLLIILSAVVDYNLSNFIFKAIKPGVKRALMLFSVTINLGLLVYFKYTDFFIDILNDLQIAKLQPLHLVLPIGISFYTFENLSYTMDVYRGKFKPVNSFLDYCFFLSFFPKLVMGPIVRAADFIPQIRKEVKITEEDIGKGLYLIVTGLFKKVVISDFIYVNYVQYIFDVPAQHSGLECLVGVYGYALVIYCDFSGYSDMAIGMARWMGFQVNVNFDSPYQSSSITEFWRRWHISLSSWLKDYLYIPLGGNKHGKVRQYLNLLVTMLLGGLWHGASLKFIFWGGLHGLALGIDKVRIYIGKRFFSGIRSVFLNKMAVVLGVIITFHFVCFCWIFFKANSFDDALVIIKQIAFNFNPQALGPMFEAYKRVLGIMALAYLLHFIPRSIELGTQNLLVKTNFWVRTLVLIFFIWLAIQANQAEQVMPVYLQF